MAAVAAAADLSLIAYGDQVAGCERCALAQTRTQVVFGSGSPTAELMFVGEAPGFHEDKQGVPFVGAAGKLLARVDTRGFQESVARRLELLELDEGLVDQSLQRVQNC